MNFIPNKHVLNKLYLFNRGNFQKGERERRKRDNFCVSNVKYKEILWRVRRRGGGEGGKK